MHRLLLPAILAAAVLLRVAVALYLGDIVDAPPLLTDQRSYHALGARIATGHGFTFDKAWYPFTAPETPTAHWSFLYSLFVAAVYAVTGIHPIAVRLVQAVLGGCLLPLAVYRLARRVFEPDTAQNMPLAANEERTSGLAPLAAAAVSAVYGYFVLYAATLMTETFFIAAVLWSLEAALRVADTIREQKRVPGLLALQLGLSLSVSTLLRQSILPWVPVLFVYLFWLGWRQGRLASALRVAVAVGGVLILSILPWTYRNYRVYGQFLLLNSNTGFAMYSAQHPMHGTKFQEFEPAPLPEGIGWGNEALMDRELMRIGIQYVLDEPGRYLLLSLSRVRAFFEFWPDPNTTWLHNVGRVGSIGLLIPFVLYGLYGMRRRIGFMRRSGLLLLFAGFYTLLHLLTWAMARYRLPVDAVMLPWAGWAIADLGQRVWRVAKRALGQPARTRNMAYSLARPDGEKHSDH
ncbi:MAG: hypothetical protein GX601_03490 [Anaerolineales bacterium]|nr:hypothetical protein [Anaerolineales bacterium]